MIDRRGLIGGGMALAAVAGLGGPTRAAGAPLVNRIRFANNRIWIAARIGKTGPHLFVIDSGGFRSLINEDFAKKLGLPVVTDRKIIGLGGTRTSNWYDGGLVTLENGVGFPDMTFVGVKALGGKAVGAFGVGMLTTHDSDLDLVKGEWRVYKQGRPDFAGLTKLPTRFSDWGSRGGKLLTRATIDGTEGEFVADTGAPSTLHVWGGAAKRSRLWDRDKPYVPIASHGVGPDAVPGRLVRGQSLRIGAFAFKRPIVNVYDPHESPLDGDGLIGLHALSQFHLSTQVSEKAVWAAWNGLGSPAPTYSGSGLWLDRDGDGVKIGDVGTGSPAAAAGIKPGDRLQGPFDAVLRAINAPYGTEIPLTVESGGTKRDVRLKLAAYL